MDVETIMHYVRWADAILLTGAAIAWGCRKLAAWQRKRQNSKQNDRE